VKTDLVDMKNPKPKKDSKEQITATPSEYHEKYPYGLRITLNQEQLDKMGIELDGLEAGSEIRLSAVGEICRFESSTCVEDGEEMKRQSLEIQITKLALVDENSFSGGFRAATK
jgi:hypothetical protein